MAQTIEAKLADSDEGELRAEKPKRRNSWDAKNAIIYDAATQTLSKEKKKNVDTSAVQPERKFENLTDLEHRRAYARSHTEANEESIEQRPYPTVCIIRLDFD
jgi:hypothetical protein